MTLDVERPLRLGHLRRTFRARSGAQERGEVRRRLESGRVRLAVIDDDPTGTQTVRDVPLVTDWDEGSLRWAMSEASPLFAVLTNTRALPALRAREINRCLGERLVAVARSLDVALRVISRSDSTLRGHFPAEPEALADGLAAAGEQIDGVLICPAYPEAGRVTADDRHWMVRGDTLVAAADTEYARDPTFGYRSSNLIDWVRERAGDGASVGSVGLEQIRGAGSRAVARRLLELRGRARYIVANAIASSDLQVLALGLELAEQEGMRLIYRTGPSFLSARAGVPIAEPLTARELPLGSRRGMVIVGSHTQLTTAQLDAAQRRHRVHVSILDVDELLSGPDGRNTAITRAEADLVAGLHGGDALLATSRCSAHDGRPGDALAVARTVADALVDVVSGVLDKVALDWVIAKGGITSHDIAVRALGARRARVLGQMFRGQISVWALGPESRQPGLRYVVFPGNVGDESTLATTLDRLKDDA